MAITPSLVRDLRERTGAGMMDCKRALEQTSGDLEQAIDFLRKQGLKSAEKKADREMGEGRVFSLIASAAGAAAPLGLILAAPVAELVGVGAWYLAGGAACVAMGIWGFLVPALMGIEQAGEITT